MLILRTGIPGHGKTLFAIQLVLTEFTDREVYYHAIDDLRLPWIPLNDPNEWFTVPDNSVIIIDEAQRVFPPRQPGSAVTKKLRELETHRHRGLDIILITQAPNLIDVHVRRLVGQHTHVTRPMGMQKAVLYTWDFCADDPKDFHQKKLALKKIVSYPTELFGAYKSATQHTVKRKIPFRLFLVPFLLAFVFYSIYKVSNLSSSLTSSIVPSAKNFPVSSNSSDSKSVDSKTAESQKPLKQLIEDNRQSYAALHTPAVASIPWTAPIYNDVRKPVTYPKMVCMSYQGQCRCYSQQSTRLDVSNDVCKRILDKGIFDYARPDLSTSDTLSSRSTPAPAPAPAPASPPG